MVTTDSEFQQTTAKSIVFCLNHPWLSYFQSMVVLWICFFPNTHTHNVNCIHSVVSCSNHAGCHIWGSTCSNYLIFHRNPWNKNISDAESNLHESPISMIFQWLSPCLLLHPSFFGGLTETVDRAAPFCEAVKLGRCAGHRWMGLVASLNRACSQFYSGAKDSGRIGPQQTKHPLSSVT